MTENHITLDRICGAALSMGFPKTSTGLIEFTGTATREHKKTLAPLSPLSSTSLPAVTTAESKLGTFIPSREAIESRLDLLQRNEYVLPVEGKFWSGYGDYLAGKEPTYKGEIDRGKAAELGLYNSAALLIRAYADSAVFPRRE